MNLNALQIIAITIAALSFISGATTTLTDLVGAGNAKLVVAGATFLGGILSSIMAVISGNISQVKNVASLPGVEQIKINTQATPALAQVATDPTQQKVGGTTAEVQAQLTNIAKGA